MKKRDYIVIELSKEMELAISNAYEERRANLFFGLVVLTLFNV